MPRDTTEDFADLIAAEALPEIASEPKFITVGELRKTATLFEYGEDAGDGLPAAWTYDKFAFDEYKPTKKVPLLDRPYSKILRQIERGGEIEMAYFHYCETKHCIAGWAVHLADVDRHSNEYYGPWDFAQLILKAAHPHRTVAGFSISRSNDDALAEIRARAALEAAE